MIVVTLYEMSPDISQTCCAIKNQILENEFTVLIYDNTPVSTNPIIDPWIYFHDHNNGGVSAAYNHAILESKKHGCEWLLILDQDTNLPDNYLNLMLKDIKKIQEEESLKNVVAIAPHVEMNGFQISPFIPSRFRNFPLKLDQGVSPSNMAAINSGVCVRIAFIESIGGYPKKFWLDFSDHWFFFMVYKNRKEVYISGLSIEHDLSIRSAKSGMSIFRYKNYLSAEQTFTNEYLPFSWNVFLEVKLIFRVLKGFFFFKDKRFLMETIRAAFHQILFLFKL